MWGQGEDTVGTPRREASAGSSSANTLMDGCPASRAARVLLTVPEAPSVWSFVKEAQQIGVEQIGRGDKQSSQPLSPKPQGLQSPLH